MTSRTESASAVSQSSSLYDQRVKNDCRHKVLKHAILSLTKERRTSVCVRRECPRQQLEQIIRESEENHLSSEEIEEMKKVVEDWESFHGSRIKTKEPNELRVCMLGGDNPTLDLDVLTKYGVCCRNVSIIEKDPKIFEKAKNAVHQSKYRTSCVKLHEDELLTFFQNHKPAPFDIIYFDGCGSLPSAKQKTLKIIGSIFLLKKLTSPGVLITNFSFPPKEHAQQRQSEKEEREQLAYVAKEYLKNKSKDITGFYNETILNQNTYEQNYSDYVTIQVTDSASLLIPAQRMLQSRKTSVWDVILKSKSNFISEVNEYCFSVDSTSEVADEHAYGFEQEAGVCRYMWSRKAVEDIGTHFYLRKIGTAMEREKQANPLCKAWVGEIFPGLPDGYLGAQNISSLLLTSLLSSSFNLFSYFANKKFRKCKKSLQCSEDGKLIAGLLYGQLSEPSYPVVDKLLRLEYKAKDRQMFCDVSVFDRCDYLFQYIPNIYMMGDCDPSEFRIVKMVLRGLKEQLKCICKKDFFQVEDLQCEFGLGEADARMPVELRLPNREILSLNGEVENPETNSETFD